MVDESADTEPYQHTFDKFKHLKVLYDFQNINIAVNNYLLCKDMVE